LLSHFPDHISFHVNAFKQGMFGRPMCGISLFIHKSLRQFVTRIDSSCRFCLFVKISKHVFGTFKDILAGFVYLPPIGSSGYATERHVGIDLLEYYIYNLGIDVFQYHLLLMGDFNARTANTPDFILPDTVNNVPQLRDHSGILTDNYEPRKSLDNVCNQQGLLLLDFCKTHSLLIANGRVGDNKSVGNYTYISSTGKSIID